MGYPIVQVDAGGLRKVGGRVEQASATVRTAFTARQDALAPPLALGDGWSSGTALHTAVTRWSSFIGNLAASVEALGCDLATAADRYDGTDVTVADRIRRSGR